MLGKTEGELWTVTHRLPGTVYVLDAASAPDLRPERRIYYRAKCPQGHEVTLTADKSVVRHYQDSQGVEVACSHCARNYRLPLGKWPIKFPEAVLNF